MGRRVHNRIRGVSNQLKSPETKTPSIMRVLPSQSSKVKSLMTALKKSKLNIIIERYFHKRCKKSKRRRRQRQCRYKKRLNSIVRGILLPRDIAWQPASNKQTLQAVRNSSRTQTTLQGRLIATNRLCLITTVPLYNIKLCITTKCKRIIARRCLISKDQENQVLRVNRGMLVNRINSNIITSSLMRYRGRCQLSIRSTHQVR